MNPSHHPGSFGGFSGGPKRAVRRAARRDLQDDQRHHPRALVHHVFVLSRCLRFSFVSFFFVTSSSVRFCFASRGRTIFFGCPEVGLENSISTSGRARWTRARHRSAQPSSVNRRRSILHIRSWTHSKTCAPPQPQREREFRTIPNRPLDTSKLKFLTDLWTLNKKCTIKVSRGRFRNSRFHHPTLRRAKKSMQISLVFIVF